LLLEMSAQRRSARSLRLLLMVQLLHILRKTISEICKGDFYDLRCC